MTNLRKVVRNMSAGQRGKEGGWWCWLSDLQQSGPVCPACKWMMSQEGHLFCGSNHFTKTGPPTAICKMHHSFVRITKSVSTAGCRVQSAIDMQSPLLLSSAEGTQRCMCVWCCCPLPVAMMMMMMIHRCCMEASCYPDLLMHHQPPCDASVHGGFHCKSRPFACNISCGPLSPACPFLHVVNMHTLH